MWGQVIDEIFRRLLERDYTQDDPEGIILKDALTNTLGRDNRGDRPTEVLLMAAWGEQGVLYRPSLRAMRWRNRAFSRSHFAHEPGACTMRTYQPGDMPRQTRIRPSLRSRHHAFYEEMSSEAASPSSQFKAAVPAKRPRLEEEIHTN